VTSSSVDCGDDYDDLLHQPQWKGLTDVMGYISISISPSPEAETLDAILPPPLPHPKNWFCNKKPVTPTLDALLEDYEEMMIEIELLEKQQQERNKLHGNCPGGEETKEGSKKKHEGGRSPTKHQVEDEAGW
jgi:hypothetical protein